MNVEYTENEKKYVGLTFNTEQSLNIHNIRRKYMTTEKTNIYSLKEL